jgi:hypothetical protein
VFLNVGMLVSSVSEKLTSGSIILDIREDLRAGFAGRIKNRVGKKIRTTQHAHSA